MYFSLAIASTLGYALQGVLMAKHFREVDSLSAVTYRGCCLGVSMLPVLLFVPFSSYSNLSLWIPYAILAAATGFIGNVLLAKAMRLLPIGLAIAIYLALATSVVVFCGTLFLRETLTLRELLLIGGLLVTSATAARGRVAPNAYISPQLPQGVLVSILGGLFTGGAHFVISLAARLTHPLLAGYAWELFIGLFGIGVLFVRKQWNGQGLEKVDVTRLRQIFVASSPTVIGTGCYTTAVAAGPIAIVTAIVSTSSALSPLFAKLIYREVLTTRQWVMVGVIAALLFSLRLSQ